MATTKIDLSVVMLKKSLAANGLPQYGTKEQMLARLLGGGEKKKPGPKPNGDGTLPKKRKATSTSSMAAVILDPCTSGTASGPVACAGVGGCHVVSSAGSGSGSSSSFRPRSRRTSGASFAAWHRRTRRCTYPCARTGRHRR